MSYELQWSQRMKKTKIQTSFIHSTNISYLLLVILYVECRLLSHTSATVSSNLPGRGESYPILPLPFEYNSITALTTLHCNYLIPCLSYPWQAEAIHLGIPSAQHSVWHIKGTTLIISLE